eukprot:CAMPEP_0119273386 /NCGR_PEP_ID=MMETSP1329-20130426/10177_1 /TAXON_ID=114041 /ORGANISM="Genus nov. species nov., Strain RCC1024" /LENGTH=50 /DNA_ID=CAMNT_0007273587 /DNA_START=95 /DNA_END=243 /DNA_ORIENTATION=+
MMAPDNDSVATLKAMFDAWDEPTLRAVLQSKNGDVEAAADAILTAGSPDA